MTSAQKPALPQRAALDALEDMIVHLLWQLGHDPLKTLDESKAQLLAQLAHRALEASADTQERDALVHAALENIRRKISEKI